MFNFRGDITPGFLYDHILKTIIVIKTPYFFLHLNREVFPRIQSCVVIELRLEPVAAHLSFNGFFSHLLCGSQNRMRGRQHAKSFLSPNIFQAKRESSKKKKKVTVQVLMTALWCLRFTEEGTN